MPRREGSEEEGGEEGEEEEEGLVGEEDFDDERDGIRRARPKSESLRTPNSSTRMLEGFRSAYKTP